MTPDLLGEFLLLARSTLSAWLFMIAGVILVVSRPRWRGSWVLLVGALVLSGVVGVRLMGILPRDANVWILVGFEAADTFGYVLAGIGILLVSLQARKNSA